MPLGERVVGEHVFDKNRPCFYCLVAARTLHRTSTNCIGRDSSNFFVLRSICLKCGTDAMTLIWGQEFSLIDTCHNSPRRGAMPLPHFFRFPPACTCTHVSPTERNCACNTFLTIARVLAQCSLITPGFRQAAVARCPPNWKNRW